MGDNSMKGVASGLYHFPPDQLATVDAEANRAHYCVLKANIGHFSAVESMLSQLGSAFLFPAWYGANFDALYDCLCDPDWQPASGHVLIINGMANLRAADPGDFSTLIEVLQAAAETRRERHEHFWILIDTPARGISTIPRA